MDFLVRLAERRGRLGSPPLHPRSTAKRKIAPQTVLEYPATAVVGVVFGVAAGVVIVVTAALSSHCCQTKSQFYNPQFSSGETLLSRCTNLRISSPHQSIRFAIPNPSRPREDQI
jgi:hypothetical protein